MRAILLCGGEGTRVRPFTLTTPKSLLPVANLPLIYYQFSLLKKYKFTDIIVGVGYKADYFRRVLPSIAKKAGVRVVVSSEKEPLGTGGGLKNTGRFFSKKDKEPLVVLNGDVITDLNLEKILTAHRKKGNYATMGIVKVTNPSPYGLVIMDPELEIKRFIEKPKRQEVITDTINAGIYIFSPEIFRDIPQKKPVSLEKEVIPSLLEKGKNFSGYIHYGYWIDVGNVDLYRKVNIDVIEGKTWLTPDVKNTSEGRFLIGQNTILKDGVRIKGRVIIGDNCFVGNGSCIEDSIILSNTVIRDRCIVSQSTIGTDVLVNNDCIISCAVIADRSLIGAFSTVTVK